MFFDAYTPISSLKLPNGSFIEKEYIYLESASGEVEIEFEVWGCFLPDSSKEERFR